MPDAHPRPGDGPPQAVAAGPLCACVIPCAAELLYLAHFWPALCPPPFSCSRFLRSFLMAPVLFCCLFSSQVLAPLPRTVEDRFLRRTAQRRGDCAGLGAFSAERRAVWYASKRACRMFCCYSAAHLSCGGTYYATLAGSALISNHQSSPVQYTLAVLLHFFHLALSGGWVLC